MKITINTITHEDKVSQRTGKNWTSCQITAIDKNGTLQKMSGFGSSTTKTWYEGAEVDVDITKNAKGYLDFRENDNSKPMPSPVLAILRRIEEKLDKILGLDVKSNTPPTTPNLAPKIQSEQEILEQFENLGK